MAARRKVALLGRNWCRRCVTAGTWARSDEEVDRHLEEATQGLGVGLAERTDARQQLAEGALVDVDLARQAALAQGPAVHEVRQHFMR